MFEIVWTKSAYNQLSKLPRILAKKIVLSIEELAKDPLNANVKKLQGTKLFRIRVGDYRVIFDIEKSKSQLIIIKVGQRKNIYKNI